jgi:DNA sulfur modification protein DndD
MIQLEKAHFRNFRLLRDVTLSFSTNPKKPLTIIRAENGAGKTTVLAALTWALFGDEALPRRRPAYRLHPIDWDVSKDGKVVEITVEVSFKTIDDQTGRETQYELIRTAFETPDAAGACDVKASEVQILKKTDKGNEIVEDPTAFITGRVLPPSLKDVFFIDGDRALAFIEASDARSEKRERVERAVKSLLGLDLLESARLHIDHARREMVHKSKQEGKGTSLEALSEQLEEVLERVKSLKAEIAQFNDDLNSTAGRKQRADEQLKAALAAGGGDRKQLEISLTDIQKRIKREEENYQQLVKQQRALVNSYQLIGELGDSVLKDASVLLTSLEEQKVIPNTLPDVVRDRLERGICICGRSVARGSEGHVVLTALLMECSELSESQEILTHLNSAVRHALSASSSEGNNRWREQAESSLGNIAQSLKSKEQSEKQEGELRAKIRLIPDKDVAMLEDMRKQEDQEYSRLLSELTRRKERLTTATKLQAELQEQREKALAKSRNLLRSLAEEVAARDLLEIIDATVESLEGDTLVEVSDEMNRIFLNMIVADPEERTGIQQAYLTREHDIVVKGPADRLLDPDRDLSGAQRRALTLSFILALVKISGEKAPNVVDTPLGMTSGLVRRAILRYAAENSSQLILFLTNSELEGVDDIIGRFCGTSYTLSNTEHYPTRLKNNPKTGRLEALVCKCGHRSSCKVCEMVEVG